VINSPEVLVNKITTQTDSDIVHANVWTCGVSVGSLTVVIYTKKTFNVY